MPRRVAREEVLAAVAGLPDDRAVFVAIDGCGGSGKSTLAQEIAARVPRAEIVATDDFQRAGVEEWDWPRLRREVVERLLAGRPARYEVRWWGEHEPRGVRVVAPGSLVVVEGVSASRTELAVPWDLTVWVDAPVAERRARIAQRDPELAEIWGEHWWPTEEAYVARDRPRERADLVVDGAG
jgi:uridine kinase